MYELYPYFTNDGSVGLYSPEANDIYHSTYGAFSEAYEKFIIPADLENFFKNHSEIKVLDICYGIGYNTKSLINFLIEKNILKLEKFPKNNFKVNTNIAPIDTNNILCGVNIDTIYSDNIVGEDFLHANPESQNINRINSGAIYSNNASCKNSVQYSRNYKIFIKALDIDINLFYLSPFFRTGNKSDKKYNKFNFHYEKISKLLNNEFSPKYQLNNFVNLIIFKNLIEKMPEIFENREFYQILKNNKYQPFFNQKMTAYLKSLYFERGKYTPIRRLIGFLHNIYYRHVSESYKKVLNSLILKDFIFEPKIGDARLSLSEDTEKYNFVFLDAFTPAKCPALWSLEFFKLFYEHLEEDGMILTYTNSAAVRAAMMSAGFKVGKIYNSELNKFTGTYAVKTNTNSSDENFATTSEKSIIKKVELSEYDLGLINSKAGIFYRDENLNGLNDEIIAAREKEVSKSDRTSSSRFIKDFKATNQSKII